MKNIILLLAVSLISLLSVGQTFTEVNPSDSPSKPIELAVGDTTYTVFETRTGTIKLQRIAKSGNEYWMYLGFMTEYRHDNHIIFQNAKRTNYYYYVVGNSGYPKAVAVTMN